MLCINCKEFIIQRFITLQFVDISFAYHLEARFCKRFFCHLVILNTKYYVGVLFGTRHKSIEIFYVDICLVEHIECRCELTGLVTDLYTDNVNYLDQISVLFKNCFCSFFIVYNQAENTEILRFCDRKRTEIDVIFLKDFLNINDRSFFILNKYR